MEKIDIEKINKSYDEQGTYIVINQLAEKVNELIDQINAIPRVKIVTKVD